MSDSFHTALLASWGHRLPTVVAAAIVGALVVLSTGIARAQAYVERPIVEVVRINTTVTAPAAVEVPPLVFWQPNRAFTIGQRECEQLVRRTRARYLGRKRVESVRQRGLAQLEELTGPEAVAPLIEVLREEREDVREWLFTHLAERVEHPLGQAALTHMAIFDQDEEWRTQALRHLEGPSNRLSEYFLEYALKCTDPELANLAAGASEKLDAVAMIPYLIMAQDRHPPKRVPGSGSTNQLLEIDHPPIHTALLALVEKDFGEFVDHGYHFDRWKKWYKEDYVPILEERQKAARQRARQHQPSTQPDSGSVDEKSRDADR